MRRGFNDGVLRVDVKSFYRHDRFLRSSSASEMVAYRGSENDCRHCCFHGILVKGTAVGQSVDDEIRGKLL